MWSTMNRVLGATASGVHSPLVPKSLPTWKRPLFSTRRTLFQRNIEATARAINPTKRSLRTAPKVAAATPARSLHVSGPRLHPPPAPKSKDRGPPSKEITQTDFTSMDILSQTPAPTTAVDVCLDDGFALNSGVKVSGAGVLLVGGEAFKWRPWVREGRPEGTIGAGAAGDDVKGVGSVAGRLQNARGQWDVDRSAWGVLDLIWPKPDLLILGTGRSILPLSPDTRRHISELGIRVEVQDTRNAAAQFNLLATERGIHQVAAALVPIGWKEGR